MISVLATCLLLASQVLCERCEQGGLQHCTCLNVSHSELQCPDRGRHQFVYQTVISEAAEMRRLECSPGVDTSILEDIEVSQVGEQSVSVSLVGCTSHRLCTPVLPVSFSFRSLFYQFFSSFSYTYNKGKAIKHLDLIGCTALENPESLGKIRDITKAEAISLFRYEDDLTGMVFKKYIFSKKRQTKESRNSTNQRNFEGINVDLSERSIAAVSHDAFWSCVTDSYHIEMLNLSHNSLPGLPSGFFPNSTFSTTKYLDLSFNLLSSLRNNIFQNFTSVADLNLAGNRLKVLANGIFQNNPLEVMIFLSC